VGGQIGVSDFEYVGEICSPQL